MNAAMAWLEGHNKLSGWAQFFGAMLTLIVTYLTVFMPVWHRKRQLKKGAKRLLLHGHEAIESYYRTSLNFLPFPLSVRQAVISFELVVDEMNRFPVFELDEQGSYSTARKLLAINGILRALALCLETIADNLEKRDATEDNQKIIRDLVGYQLKFAEDIISGKKLKRPEWNG